jgi:hypothetical protein
MEQKSPKLFMVRFDCVNSRNSEEMLEGGAVVIAGDEKEADERFRELIVGHLMFGEDYNRDLAVREVSQCAIGFLGFYQWNNEFNILWEKE